MPLIKFDPTLTDENRGGSVFVANTICTIFIVGSTGSRIATKIRARSKLQLYDALMIFTLVCNLAANSVEFKAIEAGFGRHLQFLTEEEALRCRLWLEVALIFSCLALWAVKISISFFILALIRDVYTKWKWALYGLILMTTVSSTIQAVFWGTQAQPLRKLWKPEVPGTIRKPQVFITQVIALSSLNILTDLFYALSPIYFFGRTQMTPRKKYTVLGLTGSGLLVVAAAIVRIALLNNFKDPDFTWAQTPVYIAAIMERNFAEVIADLPATFRSLNRMRKIARGKGSSSDRSGGRNGSGPPGDALGINTIGSAGKPATKGAKFGDFGAYGRNAQITNMSHDSRDNILYTNDAHNMELSVSDGWSDRCDSNGDWIANDGKPGADIHSTVERV